MKNQSLFFIAILLSVVLVIFQAMIYAFTYDVCITNIAAKFGYQVPTLSFNLFIMIEAFRQLIISGKPSKDGTTLDFRSDKFWKLMFSYFFTKIAWLIICVLITLISI